MPSANRRATGARLDDAVRAGDRGGVVQVVAGSSLHGGAGYDFRGDTPTSDVLLLATVGATVDEMGDGSADPNILAVTTIGALPVPSLALGRGALAPPAPDASRDRAESQHPHLS